jgi:hypothetical protein
LTFAGCAAHFRNNDALSFKHRIIGIHTPEKQIENLGASPQLECWNSGMME